MQIVALNHVALNVKNLEAAKRFYGEGLGLEELERPQFDFDGAWYRIGNGQELHLIADPKLASSRNRQNHHFALQVTDTLAATKALEERGLTLTLGPINRPDGVTQIFLADPDGYIVKISNP